jgi:hypothetical protein
LEILIAFVALIAPFALFFVAVLGKGIWKKEAEERIGSFEARAAELLGGRFFHAAIGITGKVLGSCPVGGDG